MALRKQIETESGLSGNYWKITNISFSPGKNLQVYMTLFASQEARLAEKKGVTIRIFEGVTQPNSFDTNLIAHCYNQLKQLDEFSGSVDV